MLIFDGTIYRDESMCGTLIVAAYNVNHAEQLVSVYFLAKLGAAEFGPRLRTVLIPCDDLRPSDACVPGVILCYVKRRPAVQVRPIPVPSVN